MRQKTPLILLILYIALFVLLGMHPHSRPVWVAENIPIVLIVVILALLYQRFRFSSTAYVFMAILVFMHTIGGHYTFERVPFGLVTDFFGFQRNHYDRIAHFSVGFYAYPVAELLLTRRWVRTRWVLFLFPVFAIFTVASVYEIVEWLYAVCSSPEAGSAFLGSQGDIWDAQNDMLADGLGAIFATCFFFMTRKKEISGMTTGSANDQATNNRQMPRTNDRMS